MDYGTIGLLALALAILATIAVVIGVVRIHKASGQVQGQSRVVTNARVVLIAILSLFITGFALWWLGLMLLTHPS